MEIGHWEENHGGEVLLLEILAVAAHSDVNTDVNVDVPGDLQAQDLLSGGICWMSLVLVDLPVEVEMTGAGNIFDPPFLFT